LGYRHYVEVSWLFHTNLRLSVVLTQLINQLYWTAYRFHVEKWQVALCGWRLYRLLLHKNNEK
jgi:hypothetical protein